MENLPISLIPPILIYLDTATIFRDFARINKSFLSATKYIGFLRSLVQRDFYISTPLYLTENYCIKLLSEGINGFKLELLENLDFKGFSTDGGVDEDSFSFWFENLFQRSQKGYCCHENRTNVNIAAVLVDSQKQHIEYYQSKKEAIKIIKEWLHKKGKDVPNKYEDAAFAVFKYVFTNFPLEALATNEDCTFKDRVREIYYNLEMKNKDVEKTRRHPNNPFILDIPIDRQGGDNENFVSCIKGLDISREGGYTCPVKTMMIFVSEKYIDVTDTCLSVFDNLFDENSVKGLVEQDWRLKTYEKCQYEGYEIIEFMQLSQGLKPVIWVNFLESPRVDSIEVELQGKFSGNYLYVKLICPEDRREERDWLHDNMNIDSTWVLPKGKIISYNDNLSLVV
ncbi:unnamed protein product [Blepharisma stoltei]|uniref:F-box domain-containing protein n=1 Tax=Blepharisma stoltei TaxID=1481888 RepID=A0AAU9IVJ9_9CILI|nr:unnamed protein product [Blepharisma stoltei]